MTLFSENYDRLIKFIFNFYDFDKDGKISKEDIRTVLSYVPLNTRNKYKTQKLKYENEDYKDRIESQDELYSILEQCFEKKDKIDFNAFNNIVENKNSDIFLFIIIFLLERKPFTTKTLEAYSNITKGISKSPEVKASKLIASPNLRSKFSPSITIQKSPSQVKKNLDLKNLNNNSSVLNKLTGKNPLGGVKVEDPKSKLSQYTKSGTKTKEDDLSKNPIRKKRDNLKNLEENISKKVSENKQHEELPLMDAKKYEKQGLVNIEGLNDDFDNDEIEDAKYEGYLYKVTQTKKLKKLWFKLIGKDLYCNYFNR